MIRYFFLLLFLFQIHYDGIAQSTRTKGFMFKPATVSDDTIRVLEMDALGQNFRFSKPDSALFYGYKALTLARKLKFIRGEVKAMRNLALSEIFLGNDVKALNLYLEAGKLAERNNLNQDNASIIWGRGYCHLRAKEFAKAIVLLKESKVLFDSFNDVPLSVIALTHIGDAFLESGQLDSALYYCRIAYEKSVKEDGNWASYYPLLELGKVYTTTGDTDLALDFLRQSLTKTFGKDGIMRSFIAIAQLYNQTAMYDSSAFYAKKSLEIAGEGGFYEFIIDASLLLSSVYETNDIKQAYQYSLKAIVYKDSLNNLIKKYGQESIVDFDEQERQREIKDAKTNFQNRLRMNAFLGITFTLLVIAFFLYRNNRLKQKAKQNIEKAYDQLKSTQTQLIQSEKMASLGELTAGIAHEIQNPLNFVNNFSEVSNELIDEMKEELAVGNNQLANEIADDIKQNLGKINHHGKRAADIVKGMLQHSRTSTGQKEPTDINALADEYLRLAYHGLRAKDKSFNADYKLELDESLPKINVIPQDIGRVLLNLINNAFYAVTEQSKLFQSAELWKSYQPLVTVSTIMLDNRIQISVKDNGPGIPLEIKDKIFQPFFTTKPTGQGTGLGLSLSYDIVKAHGGELRVETKEGEGTEFIIQIPNH